MALKIVTVVGARPQFIKAAAVSTQFSAAGIQEILIHTGQHFDANMSDVFFKELALPTPHYTLGIGNLSHGAMTGRMLEAIETVLIKEKPNWLLVYGDTNSTLAGALAAAKLHIPVAHVEAGMRSFNRQMPEEINRVMTDHLSDLLFAVSRHGQVLLQQEGIKQGVYVVGDVMLDILRQCKPLLAQGNRTCKALHVSSKTYLLATIHRAENTDQTENLRQIVAALNQLSKQSPVIWPVHPRTAQRLQTYHLSVAPTVHVIEPVGYQEMLALTSQSCLVLTDSGGLQKEAFYLEIPCVTLREETEWVETVDCGWNTLVGANTARIVAAAESSLRQPPTSSPPPIYGAGQAAPDICHILQTHVCH